MSHSPLESLFLQHLPTIDRILAILGRRHFMQPADCEEFGSWVKLRFIENNYAVLEKFRGESSIATYLNVVITTLYREYRVAELGRWRTSAAAVTRGDVAIKLETLLVRDGMALVEAAETLRSGGHTTLSDRQLADLASTFPRRAPLRPVAYTGYVPDAPDHALADEIVRSEEASKQLQDASMALTKVMHSLPKEDQIIVRLLCQDGRKICDVARGLDLPEKPLYRRFERLKKDLSTRLMNAGVSREFVRSLSLGTEQTS